MSNNLEEVQEKAKELLNETNKKLEVLGEQSKRIYDLLNN